MNRPTQDEIALRAYQIWQERDHPEGQDLEIWLEAESQLSAAAGAGEPSAPDEFAERVKDETAAESVVEYQITPAVSAKEAINAAIQKEEARAPQVPTHAAPRAKPPTTGKPLWSKPHSS